MSTAEYDAIAQWLAHCPTCIDHGEVFIEHTDPERPGLPAYELRPCPACGGGA